MIATMHCPHGNQTCTTCENSAAARELRDLRRVARAADELVKSTSRPSSGPLYALEAMLIMARETSTFLPVGLPSPAETACAACGLPTKHPPYCIECDMTGRSRAHAASREPTEPSRASALEGEPK